LEYKTGDLFRVSFSDSFLTKVYSFTQDELIVFTGEIDTLSGDTFYKMENSVGNIEWLLEEDFTPLDDTPENPHETFNKKVKEYKEEEEFEMNYEKGDLFKLVSEIPSNKLLKKGQIVELVSKGKDLYTVKDTSGKWHYVPIKFLEYYDEVAQAPLDKNIESEMVHIMDFHKQQYIDKCLDEGNFEALEKL